MPEKVASVAARLGTLRFKRYVFFLVRGIGQHVHAVRPPVPTGSRTAGAEGGEAGLLYFLLLFSVRCVWAQPPVHFLLWPILPKRCTDLALRAHVTWPPHPPHATTSCATHCEASPAFAGLPCLRNTMPSRRLPMPRHASHHGGHDWGRWCRWAGVAVVGSRPCVDL